MKVPGPHKALDVDGVFFQTRIRIETELHKPQNEEDTKKF